MKPAVCLFFLLLPLSLWSQPDFRSQQQEWVEKIKAGESAADFTWQGKYLLYTDITTTKTKSLHRLIRDAGISGIQGYKHHKQFKHDKFRYITVGEINTNDEKFFILTGWRKVEANWKKEIDIILSQKTAEKKPGQELISVLNLERKQWVRLANSHNPIIHIRESYTSDAVYFSNGRRSDGTEEIALRYGYMKNPNYQVDLKKQFLRQVSPQKIVEAGRYYAGKRVDNPGGLYVILWEKQNDGSWKIALDFNF